MGLIIGRRWRAGGDKGRVLYVDDEVVGFMNTHEDALQVVDLMNKNPHTGLAGSAEAIHRALYESRREAGIERWDVADAMAALRVFLPPRSAESYKQRKAKDDEQES